MATVDEELPLIVGDDDDFPFADTLVSYLPIVYRDLISNRVVGQEEAKKVAAMVLYNTCNIRPSTVLFAGQSGSGKTEIWRVLSCLLPNVVHIIDASQITPPGYRGVSLASLLYEVEKNKKNDPCIVVLDEVDKLLMASGEFGQEKIPQLLKLMEHTNFEMQTDAGDRKTFTWHGATASVVLLGAFTGLRNKKLKPTTSIGFQSVCSQPLADELTEQDLLDAGVPPELVGRIERIVTMEQPDGDIYRRIAKLEVDKLSKAASRMIMLSDTTLEQLVDEAEHTEMGARYIKNRICNKLDDAIFSDPRSACYVL